MLREDCARMIPLNHPLFSWRTVTTTISETDQKLDSVAILGCNKALEKPFCPPSGVNAPQVRRSKFFAKVFV